MGCSSSSPNTSSFIDLSLQPNWDANKAWVIDIIIEGRYVSLINPAHSFSTYIDGYDVYDKVIERFNGIIRKNRIDLVNSLNEEHKSSLDKIINSLN